MEYEGIVNRYKDDSCRLRLKVLVMKCKIFSPPRRRETERETERERRKRAESAAAEEREKVRRASGFEASVTSVEGFKVLCGSLRRVLVRKEVCLRILVRY